MTIKNRLKFIIGILFVFALVFALVLYLNNAMSTLHTSRADLKADTITIGTDYAGLVVKQYVEEGDKITKGEPLFEIRSQQLKDAITATPTLAATLPFTMNSSQNIVLTASDDGVVQKIFYRAGSYVPTGGIVANVNTVGTLYVEAHYRLAPPDYARIKKGSLITVTFPDNSTVQSTAYNISLVSNGTSVDTVIKARLQNANLTDLRFSVGTPVEATLKLSTKTWFQYLKDSVQNLFKPTAQ
jgi:multidrug resistance efflux pump